MKQIITLSLIFILLCSNAFAFLGAYEPGEDIFYSVVCRTDDGTKDTGCSGNDDDILPGNDSTAKSPTTALAEVSDADFPGLWRGKYTVPQGAYKGTWGIFIELTNSNGTSGATTLWFQVANSSNNGLDNLIDSIDTELDGLSSDIDANQSYLNTSFTNRFNSVDTEISSIDTELSNSFGSIYNNLTDINTSLSTYQYSIYSHITDVNESINTVLNDNSYGLSAIKTYLANTVYSFINTVFYPDMGLNFTATNSEISAVNNSIFSVNDSLSGRFDTVDTSLEGLSVDLGSNSTKTYNLLNNVWNAVTNNTLTNNVWGATTRTLTSIDWEIFGNWSRYIKMSNANTTIDYTYDSNYFIQNYTFNYTDLGTSRREIFYYDNNSYLDNVSISTIR